MKQPQVPHGCRLRPRFRGSIAPASLKPDDDAKTKPRETKFPGLYCPGLIEARAHQWRAREGRTRFRGSIAPASLKLNRVRRHGRPAGEFPGLYCPGLIEAGWHRGRAATPRPTFPGLYCPGLIEAMSGQAHTSCGVTRFRGSIAPASLKPDGRRQGRHERQVSGALLPRPH